MENCFFYCVYIKCLFESLLYIFESEFFELISKAQSHRADDQRGLLNKSHLILPDFLRRPRPCSRDYGYALNASHQTQSLDSGVEGATRRNPVRNSHRNSVRALEEEEEHAADLTLVAEGDIGSPNDLLMPPSPMTPPHPTERPRLLREEACQDWAQPGTSPV